MQNLPGTQEHSLRKKLSLVIFLEKYYKVKKKKKKEGAVPQCYATGRCSQSDSIVDMLGPKFSIFLGGCASLAF